VRYQIGEGYAGRGDNHVHINLLLGSRGGPLGQTFLTVLASPRPGHVPFLVVLQPNVPVWPPVLYVNKAEIRGDDHARLTWGASQAGVAEGMRDALKAGALDGYDRDDVLIIIAVFVGWTADNEALVRANSREAMRLALLRVGGKEGYAADFRDETLEPFNSFYHMPT
jgi:5,6,7,8-tetrahydromethanopterin hydro-lyase